MNFRPLAWCLLGGLVLLACSPRPVDGTCTDAARNGAETDVDCGGADCTRCEVGRVCLAATDCQSGSCTSGRCVASSCADTARNGAETDVDCGGGTCPGCAAGLVCAQAADCASGVCSGGVCQAPSCSDSVANGAEPDVDCGGPCPGCADGRACGAATDCTSVVCQAQVCRPATCADGITGGTETDVDCGGSCGGCADGKTCAVPPDCQSHVCTGGACQAARCTDATQNGAETDVDCGAACPPCADGKRCAAGADCVNKTCTANLCQPGSCGDLTRNQGESDVDCGGGTCPGCATGKACALARDCQSQVCAAQSCAAGSCGDAVKNGAETDVDCGGGACAKCSDGRTCSGVADCQSAVCSTVCVGSTCTDLAMNANETDVDCGGGTCAGCADGRSCSVAADCASQVCAASACSVPTCSDGVRNGAELGVDCGGACLNCATPVSGGETPSLRDSMAWLTSGAHPSQTGVTAIFDPVRFAVLHGRVIERSGAPLAAARLTIFGHPEYGQTLSRSDGTFDLAVNGGGPLMVQYELAGRITAQRRVEVPWQDVVALEAVALVALDTAVTVVDFSTPMTTHVATREGDDAGSRQATLMFAQNTAVTLSFADGGTAPLAGPIHVRATELTVGLNGRKAMPGELPPTSGYTYAVELSVDEAGAATRVSFDKPVATYVDNFLRFPVGKVVPVGWYDRQKAAWLPSADGRVIKVLAAVGGKAELVVDASGLAASSATLLAMGIGDDERSSLATRFTAGTEVWRVAVDHFTPWDMNWPYAPAPGAEYPNLPCTDSSFQGEGCPPPPLDDCDECEGSIISVQSQSLGESLPVVGAPFRLHYRSDRTSGLAVGNRLKIPITKPVVPAPLLRVDVTVSVLGKEHRQSFGTAPNQTYTFAWDGTDVWGRMVEGTFPATVRIGYVYPGIYMESGSAFGAAFGAVESSVSAGAGGSQGPILADESRNQITITQELRGKVGNAKVAQLGHGGWSIGLQHQFDPGRGRLYLGTGQQRSVDATGSQAKIIARGDWIWGVSAGADGAVYYVERYGNLLRKLDRSGVITTLAGTGARSLAGEGVPGLMADLSGPVIVAAGPDDHVYIAFSNQAGPYDARIRRVRPDGIIETFAGTNPSGFGGDGGPALLARFSSIGHMAFGPDGALYVPDSDNNRVRRIGKDGIITTIAGIGACSNAQGGDGGPARSACLMYPRAVAFAPDGTMFIGSGTYSSGLVRKVTPAGTITTIAGGGSGPEVDDIPALGASLAAVETLVRAADGTLYLGGYWSSHVRAITPEGTIVGITGYGGNNEGPAYTTGANGISLGMGPDGALLIANFNLYRVAPPLPGFNAGDLAIPSEGGDEIFVFNPVGRHLRTVNRFNRPRFDFGYDAAQRLTSVTDAHGRVTRLTRDAAGRLTEIVAPRGQTTRVTLDPSGHLATVTNPASEQFTLEHSPSGLLTKLTTPRGAQHVYTYDGDGYLASDTDPLGSMTRTTRTALASGHSVSVTNASGLVSTYALTRGSTGARLRTNTSPGGLVMTEMRLQSQETTRAIAGSAAFSVTAGSDPRFGMSTQMLASSTVRNPSALTRTETHSRSVSGGTAGNPLSATGQVDDITSNGRTFRVNRNSVAGTVAIDSPGGRRATVTLDPTDLPLRVKADNAVSDVVVTYDGGVVTAISRGTELTTPRYDTSGRVASLTNALGHAVGFEYDLAGRPSAMVSAGGRRTELGYDADGNRTSLRMPSGAVHQLTYDLRGEITGYTPPSGLAWQRTYDESARLRAITLPTAKVVAMTYDATGRLAQVGFPEGQVAMTFAGASRRPTALTRALPDGGSPQTTAFTYDGTLVTGLTTTGAANATYTFTHDSTFEVVALQLAGLPSSPRVRDGDGLLTTYGPFTLTRSGPLAATTQVSNGGALVLATAFDAAGRERARTVNVGTGTYTAALTFDAAGRIATKDETVAGARVEYRYTYDADGQLTAVEGRPNAAGAFNPLETYTYDVNGNRASRALNGGTPVALTFDAQDRVKGGPVAYTYDATGFVTQRGADVLTYSARGELLSAVVGAETVTYAYDALGRRVARTDSTGTTQYLYADRKMLPAHTRDGSGVVTAYYYDDQDRVFAVVRGAATFYVGTDQVGTPRVVVDSTGAVLMTATYDAYGALLAGNPQAFDLALGFASGLGDPVTGLVRFGFRDYDPAAGRWLARDPLLFAGGQTNLYAYVDNAPHAFRDPTGLATSICDALKRLADKEDEMNGRKNYANSVLDWWPKGNGVLDIYDGNASTPGNPGSATSDGVDFNYMETTYAGSSQMGRPLGVILNRGYNVFTNAAKWVFNSDFSWNNARQNYRENENGIAFGSLAALYPSLRAMYEDYCVCKTKR